MNEWTIAKSSHRSIASMLNFPTMRLAFNCPCALQPDRGGAILFFGTTEGRRKKEEGRRKREEGRRKKQ